MACFHLNSITIIRSGCRGRKSGQAASRQHASRPEAMPLDFVVRPQSKVDPEEVRARVKQSAQNQPRLKVHTTTIDILILLVFSFSARYHNSN